MSTIVLTVKSPDGKKTRHTRKTLKYAQKVAVDAVGHLPDIVSDEARMHGVVLTCRGVPLAQLFPLLRKTEQDAAVDTPSLGTSDDMGLPDDNLVEQLACVPSKTSSNVYHIVRDLVTKEVRCGCPAFTYSTSEPKFCKHISGLVGKGVFTEQEDDEFFLVITEPVASKEAL